MVYGCASKTVKCLVFFFNFLAFVSEVFVSFRINILTAKTLIERKTKINLIEVCGLALIIAGVFGLVSGTFYIKILADMEEGAMNDKFRFVLFVAVGLGCALALLGCLGCCGAWCENQCLLGTVIIPFYNQIKILVLLKSQLIPICT